LPIRVDRATSPPDEYELSFSSEFSDSGDSALPHPSRYHYFTDTSSTSDSDSCFDLDKFEQLLSVYWPTPKPEKVHHHDPGDLCFSDSGSDHSEGAFCDFAFEDPVPEPIKEEIPPVTHEVAFAEEPKKPPPRVRIPIRSIALSEVDLNLEALSIGDDDFGRDSEGDGFDAILQSHGGQDFGDQLPDDIGISGDLSGFGVPESIDRARSRRTLVTRRKHP
jgi:hypothetical protein